eukprot:c19884_g1_i3.p1 GENE.c19884_g1_i3~~c19884_g1_i3.p1  ORF type:complete len:222 (+),score=43.90 c19884_g1_i3:34-699(+)
MSDNIFASWVVLCNPRKGSINLYKKIWAILYKKKILFFISRTHTTPILEYTFDHNFRDAIHLSFHPHGFAIMSHDNQEICRLIAETRTEMNYWIEQLTLIFSDLPLVPTINNNTGKTLLEILSLLAETDNETEKFLIVKRNLSQQSFPCACCAAILSHFSNEENIKNILLLLYDSVSDTNNFEKVVLKTIVVDLNIRKFISKYVLRRKTKSTSDGGWIVLS